MLAIIGILIFVGLVGVSFSILDTLSKVREEGDTRKYHVLKISAIAFFVSMGVLVFTFILMMI